MSHINFIDHYGPALVIPGLFLREKESMHHLKDKENQDNLFNKDLIVKREKVTILDLNEKQDIKTLERIGEELYNDRDLPQNLIA